MSFNKKILALAVASALPGLSQAAFNLDTQVATALYADEIAITPFTTLLTNGPTQPVDGTNFLDVTNTVGFSVVGSSKYIRYNYPGTRFTTPLTPGMFTLSCGVACGTITISAGGTPSDEFVIIEIASGSVANTDSITFHPPAAVGQVTTSGKTDHAISYTLYNTPNDAINQINPLVSKSSAAATPWYKFSKALSTSCNKNGITTAQIDVTTPALFKSNPSVPGPFANPLFNLEAQINGSVYKADGTQAVLIDYLPAGSVFRVDGNFFATPGFALNLGVLPALVFGATIDPTLLFATWTTTAPPTFIPLNGIAGASTVTLTNDGITAMSPTNYSVTITPALGALSTTPINLGVCGSLVYSGSSDRIDLGLTPVSAGGANKQWLRITNPSNTSGDVAVTVWNDAGVRVDFPLSSILVGPAPGTALPVTLNQQSSTPLFTIDQVYAAAQAVNAAFTVGTGVDGKPGKLRVEVRGAFGDDHLDSHAQIGVPPIGLTLGAPSTVRLKNGIYIQAVSSATVFQSH